MNEHVASNPVPRAYRIALIAVGLLLVIATFLDVAGVRSFGVSGIPLMTPFFIMLALQMILWPTSGSFSPHTNRLFGAALLALNVLVALVSIIKFVPE